MTACMNAACKNACWVYSSGFGPEVSKQGARLFNTTIFQLLAAVIRKGSHKRLSEGFLGLRGSGHKKPESEVRR